MRITNNQLPNKSTARIFLCGFMGTGKSTIGKALAQKSGRPFYDLDEVIEKRAGQSIPQIFETKGEKKFRQLERDALISLYRIKKGVVALGGGALQNQPIVDEIKSNGLFVFIKTPMHKILERVMRNDKRPMLWNESGKMKPKETLRKDLEELYQQADVIIDTGKFPTVNEISNELQKRMMPDAK
jgi:shikimate kinase